MQHVKQDIVDIGFEEPTPEITKEPTKTLVDSYFRGGHWGQCLELLRHLCQYSENILLVSGIAGMGKTSLKNALVATDSQQFKFCEIQGSPTLEVPTLMEQIASGFNLPWDEGNESEMLEEDALHGVPNDQTWVLVIDDAELLTLPIIAALMQLTQATQDRARLHMVLFAKPNLEQEVMASYLAQQFEEQVHIIELEPLTLTEVESFLLHQWRLAGNHGELPFDKTTIKRIHSLSEGIPSEVKELAKARLTGKELRQSESKKSSVSPTLVGLTVFFGLLFAAISYIWPSSNDKTTVAVAPKAPTADDDVVSNVIPKPTNVAAVTPKASQQPVAAQEPTQPTTTNLPQQSSSTEVGAQSLSHGQVTSEVNRKLQQEYKQQLLDLKQQLADSQNMREAAEFKAQQVVASQNELQQNLKATLGAVDKLKSENSDQQQRINLLEQQLRDTKVSLEKLQVKLDKQQDHDKTVKISNITKSKKPVTTSQKFTIDEQTIMDIPAANYTLQLLGSSKEQGIKDFITNNKLGSKARYYKSSFKGKPWYILIYGSYNNREAAAKAVQELPYDVQVLNPWPREYNSIQRSIKKHG